MQTLTVEEVKAAARSYYDAGKLTAQHPEPFMRKCMYEIDGVYRCAIGACLSDETLAVIKSRFGDKPAGIRHDDMKDILEFGGATPRTEIERIQDRHDDWCHSANPQSGARKFAPGGDDIMRRRFLKVIDHPSVMDG